jgi:HEPN domain-containing protein
MNLYGYAMEWIDYAERNYDTVLLLMLHQRQHIGIIAFHCQQTAEKYLKAVLAGAEQAIPRVHDLAMLNRQTASICPALTALESVCERLTPFGTVTRYPHYSLELTENHLKAALAWTKSIRSAVRQCLGLDTESADNPNSSNIDPSPRSPS